MEIQALQHKLSSLRARKHFYYRVLVLGMCGAGAVALSLGSRNIQKLGAALQFLSIVFVIFANAITDFRAIDIEKRLQGLGKTQ